MDEGDLRNAELPGISFNGCFLAIDFRGANLRGARFTNGNVKTCDFRGANLIQAYFERFAVDGARFEGAIVGKTFFKDGYYHSATLQQADFDDWVTWEEE